MISDDGFMTLTREILKLKTINELTLLFLKYANFTHDLY